MFSLSRRFFAVAPAVARRLYLSNIPSGATRADIFRLVSKVAAPEEVFLRNSGAVVFMKTKKDASGAVKLIDGQELGGVTIRASTRLSTTQR